MRRMTQAAYAKINLTLDVLGLRGDGYHNLESVMQTVSLSDRLVITMEDQPGIRLKCETKGVPEDETNLAWKAGETFLHHARLTKKGLAIEIEKHIPVFAGIGGGSSDAAATLRCINNMSNAGFTTQELMEIGAGVGSDVPFCVQGGTALVRGRGERVNPIWALPDCWIVLCKPRFNIATPELYRKLDQSPPQRHPDTRAMLEALQSGDLLEVAKNLHNVFEDVLPQEQWEEVIAIRRLMVGEGALGSCMSGSGPTVFGLFDREDLAWKTVKGLRQFYSAVFLTQPV